MTTDEVARVRDALVFEGPNVKTKLIRFWILLILASAIAATGLLADSIATVIGAMIIAPLMLPIMGLAFGVSNGDGRVIAVSLAVGLGGIATAIGVGWVVFQFMSAAFDPTQVEQIMNRTAPNLIDLLAALFTGVAGAFAIGRKDISDTLPGVAIAISLVPPLANAGILLGAGRTDLAGGSILLFVTNYLAILLTGSLVFGLMGYPRAALVRSSRWARRTAIALAVLMFVVILVPLGFQSLQAYLSHSLVGGATDAATEWLEGSDYSIVSVGLDTKQAALRVVVSGSGELPPDSLLREKLAGRLFGADVLLEVMATTRSRIETE